MPLVDYRDQYLQYGFPLPVKGQSILKQDIQNYFSDLQHHKAVSCYLGKEKSHGAIMGPSLNLGEDLEHDSIHCSSLLTRPKDQDK